MLRILATAFIAALFTGCSAKPGDLTGTVTYKGKPVVTGQVTIKDSTGQTRGGPIKPDGSYEIKDIMSGPITVAVESPDPSQGDMNQDDPPRPKKAPEGWVKLPESYGSVETSTLKFDLKAGPNKQDLVLE